MPSTLHPASLYQLDDVLVFDFPNYQNRYISFDYRHNFYVFIIHFQIGWRLSDGLESKLIFQMSSSKYVLSYIYYTNLIGLAGFIYM